MKTLPHSNEAEKSVLGAMLLDPDVFFEIAGALKEEDFYEAAHKEIYRTAIELYKNNQPVDIITLAEALKAGNSLEMVGGRVYIASLPENVPTTANAVSYAKIIREKATLRRLIKASSEITDTAFREESDPELVLDNAEQAIFEIATSRQNKDYVSLNDVLTENITEIARLEQAGGGLTGLETGFYDFDAITSGLQKSDLIVLAARPGMGKTSFALNIAQQTAIKSGADVLIFSLEMSKEQLGLRMLSTESGIDLTSLRTGNLHTSEKWEQINRALSTLSKGHIFIDDTPGIGIMEIRNKCRRKKMEKKLDLVIIDYLQLMQYHGKAESRQQEITGLSRMLKQLAREIECPVLVLSQLSRAPDQRAADQKRPVLSDLRESGAIEQDADIVVFLYRDEYYNSETDKPNICEVNIAKHRNGATRKFELIWASAYTKFYNKETRYQEE